MTTSQPSPRPARGARAILVAVTVASVVAVFFVPRVPQDPAFHDFADDRALLGIPNFLDVVSNLPFAVVGLLGLWLLLPGRGATVAFRDPRERWPYVALFVGVALVSIGSSYYHLAPDNGRLVWDRMPITLGFTAILCATLSERVSLRLGRRLLIPLLILGLLSVLHWYQTERAGAGDLRLYGLIQFYPMVAIALMLALFPPAYTRGADWVVALLLYGAAKGFEVADEAVFAMGGIVGGHMLKHLAAAGATYWILRMLKRRAPVRS